MYDNNDACARDVFINKTMGRCVQIVVVNRTITIVVVLGVAAGRSR